MKSMFLVLLGVVTWAGLSSQAEASLLGSAESFGVLGGSTVTNTGPTTIFGDLGIWPGLEITGFPPGIVNGTIHAGNEVAQQAQEDVTGAYISLADLPFDQDLTGQDLGDLTLTPGVYRFESSAQLTGSLILDALDDPDALFVFQIGSTLTTASDSSVEFTNGGSCNVYWQVGSSATLGTDTAFAGSILALSSITLNTRANIVPGRALARNGAVTLDSNIIDIRWVPEPATGLLFGCGLAVLLAARKRRPGSVA
jgi:type VI secretion system secreted protein VgrG